MRPLHVFLLSLLLSMALQGLYWNHFDVLDGQSWVQEAEALMTLSDTMFNTFIYGYPGTPPLMLAIGVHWLFGVPLTEAFFGSLALIIALATATAAFLCALLRPNLPWWLGTTVSLSTTMLYRNATPPSAVVIPFIVIIVLLTLYIYEKKPITQRWPFILLGITIGVSAAARLDITLAVTGIEAVFLAPLIGWSAFTFVTLVAFLVFYLTNPFMWLFPAHHIRAFILKVIYHYHSRANVIPPFLNVVEASPFSWLGLFYGVLLAFWRRTEEIIPRMFILNILFVTAALVTLLYSSMYRPLWYFSPLLMVWEVIFLLLLLEFTTRATYTLGFPPKSIFALYVSARLVIFIVLVLGRAPAFSFFA